MKLTKTVVDRATYAGDGTSRDVRWDDTLAGFGVRIYPSGKKAYVLSYRVHGRKRLMTLGATSVLTVDKARLQAKQHLVGVELSQGDPLQDRQRATAGETVGDLCTAYLERHAKAKKRTWKDDERRINRHIRPAWENLKAIALNRTDVAKLHHRIGAKSPYEANRTARLLSKMFSLARQWGFVPEAHPNPARDIELFREHKRDRWVTPDELPKLAQAIDAESNEYARFALWLYLLTGARKSELLRAQWADVDWERKELRLPETKAGRTHYIPLSDAALGTLRQIPRLEGCPYVFPGAGTTPEEPTHMVNIEQPWRRVRNRAAVSLWAAHPDKQVSGLVAELTETLGRDPTRAEVEKAADFKLPTVITDVRLHDLRRTVGSWMAQAGNSLHLIGRVLNHSNASTTAIYARFGQDQVRDALEQHSTRLLGAAGKTEQAEVVEIKQGQKGR